MDTPVVLVCAGHDPSGGAGIQADIEAVAAGGGHAATVLSLLTAQNTRDVLAVEAVADPFFDRCLDTVLADIPIAAIKTGVLASAHQVERIRAIKTARPGVPLVVDPVLVAAGGASLTAEPVARAIRDQLFDIADLVTPNASEARALVETQADIDTCGRRLAELGPAVLITGGDDDTPDVVNRLYDRTGEQRRWRSPRLPGGPFHGSGCTLASAIAVRLAHGMPLTDAVDAAQDYVRVALTHARRIGHGQPVPARISAL